MSIRARLVMRALCVPYWCLVESAIGALRASALTPSLDVSGRILPHGVLPLSGEILALNIPPRTQVSRQNYSTAQTDVPTYHQGLYLPLAHVASSDIQFEISTLFVTSFAPGFSIDSPLRDTFTYCM